MELKSKVLMNRKEFNQPLIDLCNKIVETGKGTFEIKNIWDDAWYTEYSIKIEDENKMTCYSCIHIRYTPDGFKCVGDAIRENKCPNVDSRMCE